MIAEKSEKPGSPGFSPALLRKWAEARLRKLPADLVSVVIPVKNCRKYLARCLSSLSVQSYPFLQVIIVDDGSDDGSLDIARGFADSDSRFTVIQNPGPDHGPGAARNLGLRECRGKWIQFTDGDDIPGTEMIRQMVMARRFPRKPGMFPVASYIKFQGEIPQHALNSGTGEPYKAAKMPRALHRILFDGDIIRKLGMEFPKLSYAEDSLFIADYMDRGEYDPVAAYDIRYFYRLSPGSLTRDPSIRVKNAAEAFFECRKRLEDMRRRGACQAAIEYMESVTDVCRRMGHVS